MKQTQNSQNFIRQICKIFVTFQSFEYSINVIKSLSYEN